MYLGENLANIQMLFYFFLYNLDLYRYRNTYWYRHKLSIVSGLYNGMVSMSVEMWVSVSVSAYF